MPTMSDARDRDGLYSMMTAGVVRWVPVLQVGAAEPSNPMDAVATEEPLQVQVGGRPFAVIMQRRAPIASSRRLAGGRA